MHSSRKGDHAGAAPAGGSTFPIREAAVAVAQESESLAVNQMIRVRVPAATPPQRAQGKAVEPPVCKTGLPGASPGRAFTCGAIVQQQDTAMAWRRSGCDSPWLHILGHEEDSNPAPFGSARYLGQRRRKGQGRPQGGRGTGMPEHFTFRQSVGRDARRR